MTNSKLIKRSISGFIVFSLLALFCIFFIDKSLALWINKQGLDSLANYHGIRYITEDMPIILPYLALLLIICVKPAVNLGNRLLYIPYLYGVSQLAIEAKQGLKGVFGRYWPKTWINHNLSLIHDGVYGFNWFHAASYNGGSFPSGHTTFIAIISLSLAILYPRMSKLFYLLIAIMITSLVVVNYHFLGDCFGGLALVSIFANIGLLFYLYLARKIFRSNFTESNP